MGIRQSYLLIITIILLLSNNISSAELSAEQLSLMKEGTKLFSTVQKIDNKSSKYHLEYKGIPDLIETCSIVDKYSRFDNVFTKEDVLSLIVKESKLNKDAKNRNDGGAGLGQITGLKTWWKDELFWLRNPYDKDENIRGIFVVLNTFHKSYGTKYQAIKHYNGSTSKSDRYAKEVIKIRNDIFGS